MLHGRPDYARIQDPDGLIAADEPVFVLRAQDRLMAAVLIHYLKLLPMDPARAPIRQSVADQLNRVMAWQAQHGCKTPDLDQPARDDTVSPPRANSVTSLPWAAEA